MRTASRTRTALRRGALALALPVVLAAVIVVWPVTVRGEVTDAAGPVTGAVVRQRASERAAVTDEAGRFSLRLRGLAPHRMITAWKDGYYVAAADLSRDGHDLKLILKPYTQEDNPHAAWLPSNPDANEPLACGNCHPTLHAQWRRDAHSSTARNPVVLTMYSGEDVAGNRNVGPGFLRDFPGEAGNCSSCHAPGAAANNPDGVDLRRLSGEASNGVFCQFCHLIHDARVPYAETTTGVNSISLRRAPAGEHLFIGPYDDVPEPDTFRPIQRESQVCASCHSGSYWGVPAYASFDEWQASSYATRGIQCQDCHMKPDGRMTRFATACLPGYTRLPFLAETFCRLQACIDCHVSTPADERGDPTTANALAPSRAPADVFTHLSPGSRDEATLRQSVTMIVTATQGSDGVLVDVAITNSGAGHHVPSDSPMRNMILLVTARDSKGQALAYLGGERVPAWGGVGDAAAGNYAGQPGKGFAKILVDYEGEAPAPQWRNGIRIQSDNRIAAEATDISSYTFAPTTGGRLATIEVRLIYRRAFKPWADSKGWDIPDIVMAQAKKQAKRVQQAVLGAQPSVSTPAAPRGQVYTAAALARPERCAACHAAEGKAWQGSGHANATTSPLYRAWYKTASQRTQGESGPFCAGCHTPIAALNGQVRSRWAWFGREDFTPDEHAIKGVTCDVCHSIASASVKGDGAFTLSSIPTLTAQGVHARRDASPVLAGSQACAACHEATNPANGLPVMTTFSEWQRSPFASGPGAKTCQECHFQAGQHGALLPGDLTGAARVTVLPARESEDKRTLSLPIEVANVGAGHDLPTGAAELCLMWLEVTVHDANGRRVYASGLPNEYGDPGPEAVTYGVKWRDADGQPTDRLWEAVSLLRDHHIAAGAAVVETYTFDAPAGAPRPLSVRAVLKYRKSSGYLSALMTIYLKDTVPPAPVIDMAVAEAALP